MEQSPPLFTEWAYSSTQEQEPISLRALSDPIVPWVSASPQVSEASSQSSSTPETQFLEVVPPLTPGPLKLGMIQVQALVRTASTTPFLTLQAIHSARALFHLFIVKSQQYSDDPSTRSTYLAECLELRRLRQTIDEIFQNIKKLDRNDGYSKIQDYEGKTEGCFQTLCDLDDEVVQGSVRAFRKLQRIDRRKWQTIFVPTASDSSSHSTGLEIGMSSIEAITNPDIEPTGSFISAAFDRIHKPATGKSLQDPNKRRFVPYSTIRPRFTLPPSRPIGAQIMLRTRIRHPPGQRSFNADIDTTSHPIPQPSYFSADSLEPESTSTLTSQGVSTVTAGSQSNVEEVLYPSVFFPPREDNNGRFLHQDGRTVLQDLFGPYRESVYGEFDAYITPTLSSTPYLPLYSSHSWSFSPAPLSISQSYDSAANLAPSKSRSGSTSPFEPSSPLSEISTEDPSVSSAMISRATSPRLPGQRADIDQEFLGQSFRGADEDSRVRRAVLEEIQVQSWFIHHEMEPKIESENDRFSRGLGAVGRSIYTVFLAEDKKNNQWRCLFGGDENTCKKAEKCFERVERAVEHIRSHLGHRPFACDGTCVRSYATKTPCAKRFFASSYLEDHKKRPRAVQLPNGLHRPISSFASSMGGGSSVRPEAYTHHPSLTVHKPPEFITSPSGSVSTIAIPSSVTSELGSATTSAGFTPNQIPSAQTIVHFVNEHPGMNIPDTLITRELVEVSEGEGYCLIGNCGQIRAAQRVDPNYNPSTDKVYRKRIDYLMDHVKDKRFKPRPFACDHPFCSASFAREADLKRHSQTHITSMVSCPDQTCGKSYSRIDNLERHIKQKHPGLALPPGSPRTTTSSTSFL